MTRGWIAAVLALATACAEGGNDDDAAVERCTSAGDCPPGRVCVDGECGPCRENSDCESGATCSGGVCGACADIFDCAAGQACVSGVCGPCTQSSECAGGQACVAGACGPCTDNADCGGGRACIDSVCGACGSDADCVGAETCVRGVCGPCAANGDCAAGRACIDGVCGPCVESTDCAVTEACIDGVCGPCGIADDCRADAVCDATTCRTGVDASMYQCPDVTFIGGGAWGYYACNSQIWSVPTCRTLEPPNATTSDCTYVGRLPLTTDGSQAPTGATRVPMYQCPEVNSIGGGSWAYYGCQGQITNLAACTTIEYPNNTSSPCTALGDMTLYATEPTPPPGGRAVQMYQCPPSMSLGGGSWGYYGCQGQIWSVPSCRITEYPNTQTFPCTPVGWALFDP